MAKIKELEEYRQFTGKPELHKAINTLKGMVAGITTDHKISEDEINELSHWCLCHSHLIDQHPFNELIPIIKNAYEDGILTSEESDDIVWLCNSFVSDSKKDFYDLVTSSIQFLSGMIHGMLSDGELSDSEIHSLRRWVDANSFLSGCYPFDEIESLLVSILEDGIITEDERNTLKAFLSNFVDLQTSYNLNAPDFEDLRKKYSIEGICAICEHMDIEGTEICFTGQSTKASRNEIAKIITELGGIFKNNPTNKTKYLVVGNNGNPCWALSCYGRKVEDAIKRRKNGQQLLIVNETDFWDAVEDLK